MDEGRLPTPDITQHTLEDRHGIETVGVTKGQDAGSVHDQGLGSVKPSKDLQGFQSTEKSGACHGKKWFHG